MTTRLISRTPSETYCPLSLKNSIHLRLLRFVFAGGWLAFMSLWVFPALMKPYIAQKTVSQTPDFFDERLLDPATSIQDLKRLASQYPKEPSVIEKLAYVYAKEIKTPNNKINGPMAQKAIETYRKLIELDPKRVGAYNNLANIHYTLGQTDEAIRIWKKAIEVQPNFLDAQLNLGKILYTRGELKESAVHFNTVLTLDPGNAEAIVYLKRMVE